MTACWTSSSVTEMRELYVNAVWIEKGSEPDWAAGRHAIETWTQGSNVYPYEMSPSEWDEQYNGFCADRDDDGELTSFGLDEVRAEALATLARLEEVFVPNPVDGEVCILSIGPYNVWLAGDTTSGEEPPDAFQEFARFLECPGAYAAGFCQKWDPDRSINDRILDSVIGYQ